MKTNRRTFLAASAVAAVATIVPKSQVQAGVGYWLESPDVAAEGWRFRLQANFVLPKFY